MIHIDISARYEAILTIDLSVAFNWISIGTACAKCTVHILHRKLFHFNFCKHVTHECFI